MLVLLAAMTVVTIPPLARHDADCVEAAYWALSWMGDQPHDEAAENVRKVSYFFMGRLTVRNEKIDWVMSLSRDMKNRPRPTEEVYSVRLSKCADEMGRYLVTPAAQRALDRLPS